MSEVASGVSAQVLSPYLFAVSCAHGFVGAFDDIEKVKTEVIAKNPIIPFIVQKFANNISLQQNNIWIVTYNSGAVAFVSNDVEAACRVQQLYAAVGWTYNDDIDYSKQQLNTIITAAEDFLSYIRKIHLVTAAPTTEQTELDMLEKLMRNIPGGPIDQMIEQLKNEDALNERISIIDSIVDVFTVAATVEDTTTVAATVEDTTTVAATVGDATADATEIDGFTLVEADKVNIADDKVVVADPVAES